MLYGVMRGDYKLDGEIELVIPVVSYGSVRPQFNRKTGSKYYTEEYKRFRELFSKYLLGTGWCNFVKYGKVGSRNEYMYQLDVVMVFEALASWSGKERERMMGTFKDTKPDVDNLQKGVLDCLFEQDQLIVRGVSEKIWGERDVTQIFVKRYKLEKSDGKCIFNAKAAIGKVG